MNDERLRSTDDRAERETATETAAPRLRKDGQPDARYARKDERAAESRAMASRAMTDQREEMTDDERFELAASAALDSVIPTVPEIPGYSLCWVSTTHPSDTPTNRRAIGWEFVSIEDMPGFSNLCVKAGEHPGALACREMVLMKIRNGLRKRYLTHFHHTIPAEQDQKLTEQVTEMRDGRGRPIGVIEGEGLQRDAPKKPDFEHLMS